MKSNANNLSSKLIIPGLVVLLALVVIFVVLPTIQDILTLKEDIAEERAELEKQYLNGQLLKKTRAQYDEVYPHLGKLRDTILTPGDELLLITTLEDLAQSNDLDQQLAIDDLVVAKDNTKDILPLPVRVELTGTYQNIIKYLADTEQLGFYLNWESVTIRATTRQESSIVLPDLAPDSSPLPEVNSQLVRVTLSGNTYWRVQ